MAALDEVKDKKYTNWLSVNLALDYMKSGLHTFVKTEFDCLHQTLVQKIYGGTTVILPPCTMCHASRVKRDENGVWAFKKRCRSDCGVWLEELLAHHANPKSEEIYWNNSIVPSWPFQPWECAKVYMPRGQQFTNSGPAECDTQSLLMLLDKCTHFHPKLSPKGLSLTQTISALRNKIMHDGEMKLSDADRLNVIQQIIHLLEDPVHLKSLDDCKAAVSNILKIDNVSLDADLEKTAWRAVVNEFRLELGIQEKETLDTVDTLKVEYKQLREHVRKRFEDYETKTLPIQEDAQSVKSQINTLVQQEKKHQDMSTTVISHEVNLNTDVEDLDTESQECEPGILTIRGNNTNRKRKAVGKGISESGIPEKLHRSVLNRCLPQLLMDLDFKTVSIYIQQKEIFDDVTMCDISDESKESGKNRELIRRIQQRDQGTYDKFKECLVLAKQEHLKDMLEAEEERVAIHKDIETAPKRRTESDGLKQLKSQTEDKLDSVRKLRCIQTQQAVEARKLLKEKRSVVIKGNPGEGKTTIAFDLIDNEMYRERRVVVYRPTDWKTVDTDWVDIVVLEDIFGKYDLDPSCLQEWMVYLPTIQEHVDTGKLQVIITTRADILVKAFSSVESLKLFSDSLSLTLSSQNLKQFEKMDILNRELQRRNKAMNEDEKEKCIANFCGFFGFPQCCSLFAAFSNLFDKGPKFFRFPEKMFTVTINELKNEIFISLAFLFCHGKIYEEHLSPETMPKSSSDLFMELASHLHISKEKADIALLRDAYTNFEGMYIEKSISNEIVEGVAVKRSCIWFSHATVCEAVGQVLAKRSLEMVVKHGDPEYLYQRTYTAEAKDETSENVFLPVSMYSPLAERMVHDVIETSLVKSVVKHLVLKQNEFLMKLKEVLHKGNRIKDFFMANIYSNRKFKQLVSLESRLFHQRLSEGECLTFLQYVLQSDDSTVKLVFSHFMDFIVCTHNNNNSECWQCKEKQNVLELALYYHYFEIADNLITMNACYTHVSLCNAARHRDLSRVQTILEDLKRSQVLDPDCTKAKKALCRAYLSGSQDVVEILLQEGITLDSIHLVHVVQHGDINVLKKVVEQLKFHNKWHQLWSYDKRPWHFFNPDMYSSQNASILFVPDMLAGSIALYIAYCNEKLDMADYLLQNETKLLMDMLPAVTEHSSKKAVDSLIQHLKVTCIWDPHCDAASEALGKAYGAQKYDVCDMLVQEGVIMTMKNLDCMVGKFKISLEAVKKAVRYLKDTDNWDPKCNDASVALEDAYWSHNYDVCDLLIKEGVLITMKHVPHMVLRSLDSVKTVVKQLKDTDSWDPKCDDASRALADAYREEKYDVCDLLIQEEVSLTMNNLLHVVVGFNIPLEAVKKAVQHLKYTNSWDPKCDYASQALEVAYEEMKYDVYDLLIQEGVSLTMKNLPHLVMVFNISLEAVKKAVQHLKDTNNWDPKCNDASEALKVAYEEMKYDVCDLLIQEGVSLTMKNLPHLVMGFNISLEAVKKAVQHFKDTNNWDPKCDDASEALKVAYEEMKYDVCDLLIQEGVSLTMKNLPHLVMEFNISLEAVKKAVQHLKDTNNWDPKCNDASEALDFAYRSHKYDVCDLLIKEGVLITMKHVPHVVLRSLDYVKTVVKLLKDSDIWDPKCDDASQALANVYREEKYDVCDLLIQEGVSMTMKNLIFFAMGLGLSLYNVKKALQHLKDTNNWYPKCDDASKALEVAFKERKYDVCDLLIQEGVLLTMKNLRHLFLGFNISLEAVKKVVQYLKDTNNWDPSCDDASVALDFAFMSHNYDVCFAYRSHNYDVCDLLIQEGVLITMKHVPHVVSRSLDYVKTVVKLLKDTDSWDPKCDDASRALANAYIYRKYNVCDLLIQEGVSLTMKNLPLVFKGLEISLESVKKALQHLKDTNSWDPKCRKASKTLEKTFRRKMYDVCNLLIQEGVSLTMKNLPHLVLVFNISLEDVKKAVQHLKDTNNWDPNCEDAFEALEEAYRRKKYDVCDLLNQGGISITMKCIPHVILRSLDYVKTVVKQLKDSDRWDPMCDDATKALEEAFKKKKYDVCDLLIEEGVSVTVKNLPHVVAGFEVSVEAVKKVVQHLKDTYNWDRKCNDASKALENAYGEQRYEVCDLLIQEGISLTMKNIPGVVYYASLKHVKKAVMHLDKCLSLVVRNPIPKGTFRVPLKTVKKAIEHLKENENWNAKSDEASEALANAYSAQMYDVCDMLLEESVSLTMKHFPGVVVGFEVSYKAVIKAMEQLKATDMWDPKCEYASRALANAYSKEMYDVCDLLVQEGVSLTMQTFNGVVEGFPVLLEVVKKALQHLKDAENWVPSCEHASKALENAYVMQNYDVCDLLIQEGVSLSMKNIPGVVYSVSFKYVMKVIQHMDRYDVFDLLVLKRVSLTLKNLPYVVERSRVSLKAVSKVIHHLKETKKWDPKSEYASVALTNASSAHIYDVCDLLAKEGVLPDNEESFANGAGISGIIGSS
ncbi:hypothetical protein ACJMK2_022261 [Sinanodonta woodiana]|uniref:Novel STAND NTPase 3 domain-containing protein n=1 Tax=Sinanodonta woodiana TaxID=1069815 RepID=A0ABD3TKJ0_SINWO